MSQIAYARRAIERRSLSINEIFSPEEHRVNFAVFGGSENERVEVFIQGMRRSINKQAIIILHDSPLFISALTQQFRPVHQLDIGKNTFDLLIGVGRNDAMDVRHALHDSVSNRSILCIRSPSGDQALQRMLASELLGLTYDPGEFLLVLYGLSQPAESSLVNMMFGEHTSHYSTAIAGSSITRAVSFNYMQDVLQGYDEIAVLPIEDMQEARRISECFGVYMRSYAQHTVHMHGIWPFRQRNNGNGFMQQQAPTSNIDPAFLKNHTLVCGRAFPEPIMVKELKL